ncbi:hypothetical protein ACN42_g3679 [Penicillium freii]|uniref:Uncharacterized protein n=1 Tax=Penicillium freii TaxID=48697 RepID=A0A101MMS0_PENFR|nr:hypothetical protein ACN42_g3679 [Penicillium freii]
MKSPSQTSFGHTGGHTSSPLSVDSSQINHRQANAKKKEKNWEDQGQRINVMSKEKGQAMIGSASEDAFKDLQYQRLNNPTKKKEIAG